MHSVFIMMFPALLLTMFHGSPFNCDVLGYPAVVGIYTRWIFQVIMSNITKVKVSLVVLRLYPRLSQNYLLFYLIFINQLLSMTDSMLLSLSTPVEYNNTHCRPSHRNRLATTTVEHRETHPVAVICNKDQTVDHIIVHNAFHANLISSYSEVLTRTSSFRLEVKNTALRSYEGGYQQYLSSF